MLRKVPHGISYRFFHRRHRKRTLRKHRARRRSGIETITAYDSVNLIGIQPPDRLFRVTVFADGDQEPEPQLFCLNDCGICIMREIFVRQISHDQPQRIRAPVAKGAGNGDRLIFQLMNRRFDSLPGFRAHPYPGRLVDILRHQCKIDIRQSGDIFQCDTQFRVPPVSY